MELKIQKLKNWKKIIIGVTIVIGITLAITLTTSKAKYRITESIPLIRGKISYKPADLNVVAVYQQNESGEYESADTVPSDGYTLSEAESYCEVNKVKDESITLEYKNGLVNFNNISKKGTKCYLYFDKYVEPTMKNILSQRNIIAMPEITGVETADTTGTIYSVEDDLGTSYVFRGAPTDNWVSFGGFYWRIIRMNGDGSTRMIYAGESIETTGTDDQLASTSAFNTNYNDNAYVGYMYGSTGASSYANAHANTNNSTIKGALDTWYSTYLYNKTGVAEYIDGNAGFCGDRTPSTSNTTSNGSGGTGTTETYYGDYIRYYKSGTPTLKCANSSDLYTTSSSSRGNKALSNPIGLINMNEVWLAGGYKATNESYYLYTGEDYWTMSPCFFGTSQSRAYGFRVDSNGFLGNLDFLNYVGYSLGVRPVINLKADTKFTGTGLANNPLQISGI